MSVQNYSTPRARTHEEIKAAIQKEVAIVLDRPEHAFEIERIRVLEEIRREIGVLSGVLANIRDKVVTSNQ